MDDHIYTVHPGMRPCDGPHPGFLPSGHLGPSHQNNLCPFLAYIVHNNSNIQGKIMRRTQQMLCHGIFTFVVYSLQFSSQTNKSHVTGKNDVKTTSQLQIGTLRVFHHKTRIGCNLVQLTHKTRSDRQSLRQSPPHLCVKIRTQTRDVLEMLSLRRSDA